MSDVANESLSCSLKRNEDSHCTTGGVSNVWYGAGDGNVHSSVDPPSHGFAGAFSRPRMHLTPAYGNTRVDRPKPNAPIDTIMFQSAHCRAHARIRRGIPASPTK